jgi:hypothetical protein
VQTTTIPAGTTLLTLAPNGAPNRTGMTIECGERDVPIVAVLAVNEQHAAEFLIVRLNGEEYAMHAEDVRPTVRGLNGTIRPWRHVFAAPNTQARHHHGHTTTTGYTVRRTFFDRTRPHEDVQHFDAHEYSDATILADEVRQITADGYAVIDYHYACGCRTNG